jgi:arylsulfatase A-like enzyme
VILLTFLIFFTTRKKITQDPQKKYNVILIVSDALRFDVLGCNGGEASTPNINWLAENGICFQNAYSTSPWTTPSAVSMFTGNHARVYQIGIRKIFKKKIEVKKIAYLVPDSALILPEVLKKLNYDTILQINNPNAWVSNNLQGFQDIENFKTVSNKRRRFIEKKTGIREHNHTYRMLYPTLDYFLKNDGKNFFALIWITDPHAPYDPISKYRNNITIDKTELPREPEYYQKIGSFHTWENKKITEIENDYIKKLYIAEVESVDERVGYIIKALKYKNLLKNTLIIFTSDHGESFGEHGIYDHGTSYYEELVHIPLIYFGPGLLKNSKIHTPVSNLDLIPTIKDLLGVKYQCQFQGKSYHTLLRGKTIIPRMLFIEGLDRFGSIKRDFIDCLILKKLKLFTFKKNRFELYNLSRDFHEMKNLAKFNQNTVKKLYKYILKQRKENEILRKKNLKHSPGNQIIIENREEWKKWKKTLKTLGYV